MANPNKQLAFYFDQTRCHGCQTCVVACKDWNGVKPGPAKWRDIYDVEDGEYPIAENNWNNGKEFQTYIASYSCNHCENPACVDACAYQAIFKRKSDGIVIIDRDKCQGLGECVKACPYQAPKFADDIQEVPTLPLSTATKGHTAQKCNFCWDRLDDGKAPACVVSCLMRAFDFGTLEDLREKYPDAVSIADGNVPGFPADDRGSDGRKLAKRTNPSMLVKIRK